MTTLHVQENVENLEITPNMRKVTSKTPNDILVIKYQMKVKFDEGLFGQTFDSHDAAVIKVGGRFTIIKGYVFLFFVLPLLSLGLADFSLNSLREGVMGMVVGQTNILTIPPELAYGEKNMPANTTHRVPVYAGSTICM
jgi:FKBP-type peptidyl-prolyl cis-trans isomerase 2